MSSKMKAAVEFLPEVAERKVLFQPYLQMGKPRHFYLY